MKPESSSAELHTPTARDFLVANTSFPVHKDNYGALNAFFSQDLFPASKTTLSRQYLPAALHVQPLKGIPSVSPCSFAVCPGCNFAVNEFCVPVEKGVKCVCGRVYPYAHEVPRGLDTLFELDGARTAANLELSFVLDCTAAAAKQHLIEQFARIFSRDMLYFLRANSARLYFFLITSRVHFLRVGRQVLLDTLHQDNQQCIYQDYSIKEEVLEDFFAEKLCQLAAWLQREEHELSNTISDCKRESRPIADALLLIPTRRLVFVICAGASDSALFPIDDDEDEVGQLAPRGVFRIMAYGDEFGQNQFNFYCASQSDARLAQFYALARKSGGALECYRNELGKLIYDVRKRLFKLQDLKFDVYLLVRMPQQLRASYLIACGREGRVYAAGSELGCTVLFEFSKQGGTLQNSEFFQVITTFSSGFGGSGRRFARVLTLKQSTSDNALQCLGSVSAYRAAFALAKIASFQAFPLVDEEPGFGLEDGFYSVCEHFGAMSVELVMIQRANGRMPYLDVILQGVYGLMNSNLLLEDASANDRVQAAARLLTADLTNALRVVYPVVYACDVRDHARFLQIRPETSVLHSRSGFYAVVCENKRGSKLCVIVDSTRLRKFDATLEPRQDTLAGVVYHDADSAQESTPCQSVFSSALEAEVDSELPVLDYDISFGDLLGWQNTQQVIYQLAQMDDALLKGGIVLLDYKSQKQLIDSLLYESGAQLAPLRVWLQNLSLAADEFVRKQRFHE